MKRALHLLLAGFLCLSVISPSSASIYQVPLEEKLDRSSLIIEGVVVSQYCYWNAQHTFIFTASTIQVSKAYKGTVPASGKIEVLTMGGRLGDFVCSASDLLKLHVGDKGVFCINANTQGFIAPQSGNLLYVPYADAQSFFVYNHDGSVGGPFIHYDNVEDDLYPALEARLGRARVVDPAFVPYTKLAGKVTAVSVSGFSPSTVRPGAFDNAANSTLTISGSGFGAVPSGSCAVLFKNADDGGSSSIVIPYNDLRVTSWSDVQIVIKVPTEAGIGVVTVRDAVGSTGASASSLGVEFAILSAEFASTVEEYNLMKANASGGYTFRSSTSSAGGGSVFDGSSAETTFLRAISTWQTLAGINFTEGGSTSAQAIASSDSTCIIQFDNTNTGVSVLGSGTLAVCYSFATGCSLGTNAAQLRGFDITVRSSASSGSTTFELGPCPPTTAGTVYDMESVMLHELGHALGLGHIIDGTEGSYPNMNPGKLMNFAITNGMKRATPDGSAFSGAQYCIATTANTYGAGCVYGSGGEMTALSTTVDARDACPASFPSVATNQNTSISINLTGATADKDEDPAYNKMNTGGTGVGVTNTVFYAFKTDASGGTLTLTVSGYGTTPAAASSSCTALTDVGVEMAVYQVSSCPASGPAYPTPVASQSFNANGALTTITGLAANTNYLMVFDGVDNTKASFSMLLGGTSLPIYISNFQGIDKGEFNHLYWNVDNMQKINSIEIQRSVNGKEFRTIGYLSTLGAKIEDVSAYDDRSPLNGENYYRLKVNQDNDEIEYSHTIMLRHKGAGNAFYMSPNPAASSVTLRADINDDRSLVIHAVDMKGATVASYNVAAVKGSNEYTLDLAHFAPGVYLINVTDAEGSFRESIRLVKE